MRPDIFNAVKAKAVVSRTLAGCGLWCLVMWGSAYGHVYHSCLQQVAHEAQMLKQCTTTRHSDHCRDQRQALSDQVRVCQQQQFTSDAIEAAIREGESKVAGDSTYYLPEKNANIPQAAFDAGRGNVANFRGQFANVSAFPVEDLDYGVNQGGCHQAFLASPGRHQFLGHFEFKRYWVGESLQAEPYRLYFFARMAEGVCYAAPKAGQSMDNGDLVVLNLPTSFFAFLKQAVRQAGAEAVIVECADETECTQKKRKAVSLQVDYHATYLRLQRMEQCQEQAKDNRWYRRMAKLRLEKDELPTHCMEADLENNIRQLKDSLRDTGKQLFEGL